MSNKILGTVIVNEVYQSDYSYELSEKQGKNFGEDFKPDLTPKQMLDLGIFGGNYFVEIPNEFPRTWFKKAKGWVLWYCRYYQGRRIDEEDHRQIKRWKNMKRHITQLQNNCDIGDENCRPRQRQALLHWAYDSRNL